MTRAGAAILIAQFTAAIAAGLVGEVLYHVTHQLVLSVAAGLLSGGFFMGAVLKFLGVLPEQRR